MAKSNAAKLAEFHAAMGEDVDIPPNLPAAEIVKLRQTLIREEFAEVMAELEQLQAAQGEGKTADFVPLMHELADLLYVTYGTFVAFGVNADAVFAEVHRANMQKLSGPRRADGKLLKPPNWQPANVRGVIEQMKG